MGLTGFPDSCQGGGQGRLSLRQPLAHTAQRSLAAPSHPDSQLAPRRPLPLPRRLPALWLQPRNANLGPLSARPSTAFEKSRRVNSGLEGNEAFSWITPPRDPLGPRSLETPPPPAQGRSNAAEKASHYIAHAQPSHHPFPLPPPFGANGSLSFSSPIHAVGGTRVLARPGCGRGRTGLAPSAKEDPGSIGATQ